MGRAYVWWDQLGRKCGPMTGKDAFDIVFRFVESSSYSHRFTLLQVVDTGEFVRVKHKLRQRPELLGDE